jgi:hypothetical protein
MNIIELVEGLWSLTESIKGVLILCVITIFMRYVHHSMVNQANGDSLNSTLAQVSVPFTYWISTGFLWLTCIIFGLFLLRSWFNSTRY